MQLVKDWAEAPALDFESPMPRIVKIAAAAVVVTAVLTLVAIQVVRSISKASGLPPLPEVSTSSFEPGVRDQIEEALATARASPTDANAIGQLGMVLHAYGQYAAAAEVYQRAGLLAPENFNWLYYRGVALTLAAKGDAAFDVFQQALPLRPDYAPLRLKLGSLYQGRGDTENAVLHFRTALELDPTSAIAYFGMGQALTTQGQLEAAARQFRKALSLAPRFAAAHYAIGLVYRDLGDDERARQHLDLSQQHGDSRPPMHDPLLGAVVSLGESATQHRSRARELAAQGRSEAAVRELLKALESDPESLPVHVDLVQAYSNLGQIDKAEQHFRTAVTIYPKTETARLYYSRSLIQQGRFAEAAEILQALVEINPRSTRGHLALGSVLDDLNRPEEAIHHYRIALKNDPNLPQANFLLALHLIESGDLEEAESHIEKALQVADSERGLLQYQIGLAFGRSGYPERAVAYLEDARQSASRAGRRPLLAEVERALGKWSQGAEAQ